MPQASKHILLTGGAGFIGSHLLQKLVAEGYRVTVIDNFDPFYDRAIKEKNLQGILPNEAVFFQEMDITDAEALNTLQGNFFAIVHLAAKAGVRPSIQNPVAYQDVNVKGTQNLLEFARHRNITQFVFASSSSVYGINENMPWQESDHILNPISPYASTKISGELLGHVYSHLFGIRFLALRFFTVYGPRQRPDLAINLFIRKILAGEAVSLFGDGSTRRDYTYVADIVEGIFSAINYDATAYEIINLGNNNTVSLLQMLKTIEEQLGTKAIIEHLPQQPGDVPATYADITKAQQLLSYKPATSFDAGVANFISWYRAQHNV